MNETNMNYGTRNVNTPYLFQVSEDTDESQVKELVVTTDVTGKVVGEFGRWQLNVCIMMALLKLPMAWYQLNIIFLAPPQDFWCKKPKAFMKYSDEVWRAISAPVIEEHPCLIFDPEILHNSPYMNRRKIPLIACKNFTYDTSTFSRTITSEWDLVCSKHWLIHVSQCVMMWGILLGGIIFGSIADRRGRKYPLMISLLIQAVSGLISGFTPTFTWFLVNRFVLALACGGYVIISFVMSMEVVSGKWRTLMPVICQLPYGLGNAVMAGLSYWLRDWRKLEFSLAFLSSFFLLYWFWLPESPRWLLATGQTEKALQILKEAARINKRPFESKEVKEILECKVVPKSPPSFFTFIKSKNMRIKTVLLSINWFCTGLAFYSFSQYLGMLGGNIFIMVAVCGIISTPGAGVCIFVITRVGRKTTVAVFQLVTGLCFMAILVIPRNSFVNDWPVLLCAGVGLAGMSGAVPALYLLSAELYPTLGRNVGVGGVTTFARIGSMVAPVFITLDEIVVNFTLISLAIMSFSQIFLLLPLPETRGFPLPDTLEDAEKVTRKKRQRRKMSQNSLRTSKGPTP